MTAPVQSPPVPGLVAINWLRLALGHDRVARTEPDDQTTIAAGFVKVPTVTTGGELGREISFTVEFLRAPAAGSSRVPWNTVEEDAAALRRYVKARPTLRDRVTIPNRGRVLVTSVRLDGPDLVLGDLGGLARADMSVSLKWRPIR